MKIERWCLKPHISSDRMFPDRHYYSRCSCFVQNEKLFHEMYIAYRSGRAEKNPADFWYDGELGFFDYYIIPLAKKLDNCGVFGVSSDENLNYALQNRQEWKSKGRQVVEGYLEKFQYREIREEDEEGSDESRSIVIDSSSDDDMTTDMLEIVNTNRSTGALSVMTGDLSSPELLMAVAGSDSDVGDDDCDEEVAAAARGDSGAMTLSSTTSTHDVDDEKVDIVSEAREVVQAHDVTVSTPWPEEKIPCASSPSTTATTAVNNGSSSSGSGSGRSSSRSRHSTGLTRQRRQSRQNLRNIEYEFQMYKEGSGRGDSSSSNDSNSNNSIL